METLFNELAGWMENASLIIGIVATVLSIRENTQSRKMDNAIALTGNHRDLWTTYLEDKRLARVLDAKADTEKQPPTEEEKLFVTMLILHIRTALKAREIGFEFGDENMESDIRQVFELPVPKAVWQEVRKFHSGIVEEVIDSKPRQRRGLKKSNKINIKNSISALIHRHLDRGKPNPVY